MKRKIYYFCTNCNKQFDKKEDCAMHEKTCTNKFYLAHSYKLRILKLLDSYESNGFTISINYDTNRDNRLVSVLPKK